MEVENRRTINLMIADISIRARELVEAEQAFEKARSSLETAEFKLSNFLEGFEKKTTDTTK